jgi:hypothetical protein
MGERVEKGEVRLKIGESAPSLPATSTCGLPPTTHVQIRRGPSSWTTYLERSKERTDSDLTIGWWWITVMLSSIPLRRLATPLSSAGPAKAQRGTTKSIRVASNYTESPDFRMVSSLWQQAAVFPSTRPPRPICRAQTLSFRRSTHRPSSRAFTTRNIFLIHPLQGPQREKRGQFQMYFRSIVYLSLLAK